MTKWKNEAEILAAANKAPDKPKGWQRLELSDISKLLNDFDVDFNDNGRFYDFARAVEQAIKDKNDSR